MPPLHNELHYIKLLEQQLAALWAKHSMWNIFSHLHWPTNLDQHKTENVIKQKRITSIPVGGKKIKYHHKSNTNIPSAKLIPKPKGEAGHGGENGFNLQQKMGLANHTNKFNWLLVSSQKISQPFMEQFVMLQSAVQKLCVKHLINGKTISKQLIAKLGIVLTFVSSSF